jgi:hypothetical protein
VRTLVVGSYPPTPGPESAATLASVREALRAGSDVRVLSPEAGAAHEHDVLSGLAGAWSLLRRAPRFDSLVLHIEPGLPLRSGTGRIGRIAQCAAIGLALGRYRDVTVYLDDPLAIPGSVGGRTGQMLWRNVHHVVVRDELDRTFMHEMVGVPLDRITTRAKPASDAEGFTGPPRLVALGQLGEPRWRAELLSAADAMAEVRARAAAKRAAAGPAVARRAAARSAVPAPVPPPGVVSVLARRALKRALGRRAPAVGAAARRIRSRVHR